ncbi:heme-degrading domain-containing protein [Rhizobium helianthi]|uniref:UPF0303 protein ACFSE1_01560 n=1 Tax=Rhizobium helianthi TaxID=1132695 RepID=A0ABW4M0N8_9HYPH
MSVVEDLEIIAEQERALEFDRFDLDTAWSLGATLRELAVSRRQVLAVDVTINGMQAFFTNLPGGRPDFEHWIRRKRNLTLRLLRPSYAIGLELKRLETTLEAKWELSTADFASHGGCFPIRVKGVGCIGAVTVSGLPQRDDHNLAVEGLAELLGVRAVVPTLA